MAIQLKVYNADRTEQLFLDLYETEPIKLTLSVEDILTTDATSVFSRTFRVPATRHNEEFFKQAFLVNGITYDVTTKKDAEILVDGAEFKQGHIRLQKIYVNGDLDKVDYELLFLGETRDFSTKISDKPMCHLIMTDFSWANLPVSYSNASDYIGPFTYNNIVDSWQAFPETSSLTTGYANGDMLFPLIDHGNTYQNGHPVESVISLSNTGGGGGGGNKRFTNSTWPLNIERMKPMIRAKRVWDQIFEDAEYTYESVFLNSDRFKQMYASAFGNKESIQMDIDQNTTTNFSSVENVDNQEASYASTPIYLTLNDMVYNPGGTYHTSGASSGTGSYFEAIGTASLVGNYYILNANAEISMRDDNASVGFTFVPGVLKLIAVSGPGITTPIVLSTGNMANAGGTSSLYYDSRNGGFQIGAGTELQLVVTPYLVSYTFTQSTVSNVNWNCVAAPGSYYAPQDLDCEYKQIDYIKDILTMFRLVLSPSNTRVNHFIVEPWQEFIGKGDTVDWSHKLDKNKDVVIDPLFNTQSQSIEFSLTEDEDYINKFHQDNSKHPYGWLKYDSNNELLKGTRKISLIGISPTPLEQIEQRDGSSHADPTFILPVIHKHETGDANTEHTAIKPNTRFLFYNGLIALTDSSSHWNLSNSGTAIQQQYYPLVSPYESWPPTPSGLNLNFHNDTRYYLYPNPGVGYFDQSPTLFDEFWSTYINSLYNKFARRITANFILDNTDLQNLTFDDTIFVNSVYYRPEKIINAEVGAKTSVKVQLITLQNPTPRWSNEPLNVISVVTEAPTCFDGLGSVTIVTEGSPLFTMELDNGYVSTYNDVLGLPDYTMTFDSIPPGTYTMTLTDSLNRIWIQTITIAVSSATGAPTWSVSDINDPTVCDAPGCNGEMTVNMTGGIAPYTITWNDGVITGPSNGPFTRTDLCADILYEFTVEDSVGCTTPVGTMDFICDAPSIYYYEVREQLNNCSSSSATPIIVSSTSYVPNGAVVSLNGIQGCYLVIYNGSGPAAYSIDTVYPTCVDCENMTIKYECYEFTGPGTYEYVGIDTQVHYLTMIEFQRDVVECCQVGSVIKTSGTGNFTRSYFDCTSSKQCT